LSSFGPNENTLSATLIEHVLTNPKIRDLFKNSSTKGDLLVDKLILLMKTCKEVD